MGLLCACHNAGLSYNWLLGKFMVFSTDAEVSRRMLSVNDPAALLMAVHPSAKHILGPNNLAFMHGLAHKAIRKSFLALFTRCALPTVPDDLLTVVAACSLDRRRERHRHACLLSACELPCACVPAGFRGAFEEYCPGRTAEDMTLSC